MDLKRFESLIKIAKKHNVDSFSCDGLTVNIGVEIPDFPADPIAPLDEIPDEPSGKDYLLTNPMGMG